MANLDAIGIQSISTATVENFNLKKSLSVSPVVRASAGGFHAAQAFDPVFDGSVRGKGDRPAGFLLGTDGGLEIAGVTGGKTLLLEIEDNQKNEAHNGYSISFRNRPAA
jgi:hypothetical protein